MADHQQPTALTAGAILLCLALLLLWRQYR